MTNIAGLVLASGRGRRPGQPEASIVYHGRSLLDHAVATLREGGCRQVLAVLGAQAEVALGAAREPFTPVLDRRWGQGPSTSLRAGLAAVPDRFDGVVVTLVDRPRVVPEAVRRLIAAAEGGAALAVATYDGERGHPVLFARERFGGIADDAPGDRGLPLSTDAHAVREVPCPGDAGAIGAATGVAAAVRR